MTDINCDLGEGMKNDEALMPYISSANIACGRHAGDRDTMKRTMELCLLHQVKIGAHPGFADKENFGRLEIHLSGNELTDLFSSQIEEAQQVAAELGTTVHHVKPHGAMYNMAAKDASYSRILLRALAAINPSVVFYGLSGSCMIQEAGSFQIKTASEVFADRNYNAAGKLLPRNDPRALITDPQEAWAHVKRMVLHQELQTSDGRILPVLAETICLHGDHPAALEIARRIAPLLASSE